MELGGCFTYWAWQSEWDNTRALRLVRRQSSSLISNQGLPLGLGHSPIHKLIIASAEAYWNACEVR